MLKNINVDTDVMPKCASTILLRVHIIENLDA